MVIFDCNGVLVDSEPIASAVLAEALTRAGCRSERRRVARRFHGRRPADIFAAIEAATGKSCRPAFASAVADETLRRFRTQLRALPHVAHALTWIRGPKAVASSSPLDRVRASLDIVGLLQFFGPRLFSASNVARGKPAPDVFQFAAARLCRSIQPTASSWKIQCRVLPLPSRPGCEPVGYVGGSQTPGRLARDLVAAGAHTAIADMRVLKGSIADLRGW